MAIRLSPRAKLDRLTAIGVAAEGRRVIKASVTAPAEGGRANEALLRLLSVNWRIPRRDFSIVRGLTNRDKVVYVAGNPLTLREQIFAAIAELPGW